MITLSLLKEAYKNYIVQIINSPHGDGTVAKIGGYWFYFGGETAESMTAAQYLQQIPEETIILELYEVLNDFYNDSSMRDEYEYYEAYIREKLGLLQIADASVLEKLGGPELSFEISESGMDLDTIITAVQNAYPGWKFNRTEVRYESCLMAIFEKV
jgi:hypothetical protein